MTKKRKRIKWKYVDQANQLLGKADVRRTFAGGGKVWADQPRKTVKFGMFRINGEYAKKDIKKATKLLKKAGF